MTETQDLETLRLSWLGDQADLRRSARRSLCRPVPAWLAAAALGPEPLRADLLDTSAGGVCLALASPCPLQPGDAVQLSWADGPPRPALVRWREETSLIVALGVAYDDSSADS